MTHHLFSTATDVRVYEGPKEEALPIRSSLLFH